MRTTWNGAISFGLVNIPVGIAPATKAVARQSDVSFRLLHRECGTPIKQKRWCPTHDCEVGSDDIVKGWEASKGQFVLVEQADLETLEAADTSKTIELTQFVSLDAVDPIYFDRTYFLVPGATIAARRPYVLIQEAMRATGRAALGRFVLAGKEKRVLIRARGGALAMETLFLAEDVNSQAEIDEAVELTDANEAEVELAKQVIASLDGDFDPATLTSEYRSKLRAMLAAKLDGSEVVQPEPAVESTPVVDLMEALRASIDAAKSSTEGAKPRARKKRGATA